jgi:hypothetical protein
LRHDIAAQRGQIVDPGVARRHHRGGALKLHQLVGGDADRRAVGIDMTVQVDQPRRHQFSRSIDRLRNAGGGNFVLDRLDHAPANTDIALSPQRLAGVEYVAALDHEVELVVRSHRSIGRTGHHGHRRRSGQTQKITA